MDNSVDETLALLKDVLTTGKLTRGRFVKQAEEKLQSILGHKYLSLTSSGTGGIHAGLLALGLQPGDEVITTSYTFSAPLNMILACGATPVLVDQDESYRMHVSQLENALSSKTKGILVVDLYGIVNDYEAIFEFAQKYGLWILSDSCQSLGSKTKTGDDPMKYCDILVGSFFETKHISTGEGGVVLTKSPKLLQRVNTYTSHGQPRGVQYDYQVIGFNYRPTELQAAVLLPKLKFWEEDRKLRQSQVKAYTEALTPLAKQMRLPMFSSHDIPSQYPIQVSPKDHDPLKSYLAKQHVNFKLEYPLALHEYPVYAERTRRPVSLKRSEAFGRETIIFSLGSGSLVEKKEKIYEALARYFAK